MHYFTTFERTAPVGDDNDPIRKHMKKFRCQACKKDKFHIPLKTVDGRTVCIHCCLSESGQNIVLDKRTVESLDAIADRIKGYDNYPPKETNQIEDKEKKSIWKTFKQDFRFLFSWRTWKDIFSYAKEKTAYYLRDDDFRRCLELYGLIFFIAFCACAIRFSKALEPFRQLFS